MRSPSLSHPAGTDFSRRRHRLNGAFVEYIEYDLDDLRNWSPRVGLFVIAKTVGVVLKGWHAYRDSRAVP